MKKLTILIMIAAIFMSSCEDNNIEPNNQNTDNNEMKVNESDPSKYTAQGKIIKIDGNDLHVQDGDKVDVYNVDPERTESLFIGEYVGINKLDGDKFDVVLEGNHDYNTRLTTDGKAITRVSGTVGEVTNENVTAITEMGEIKLSRTGDFDLNSGDQFMCDYIDSVGRKQMLAFYDEASKINMAVKEISRDSNGMMRIFAISNSNKEYDIMVGADTLTSFVHSSLESDEKIVVYPNDISGDVTAAVDAKLIVLNDEKEL